MTDESNVPIHNTMGAALIGVICAGILYGGTFIFSTVSYRPTQHLSQVSCVQSWYYFNKYTQDIWYIKSLVGAVWALDSIHQGLISHTVSNQNVWLTSLIGALILANCACSIAFVIQSMQLTTWLQLLNLKGLSMTVNVLGAAADALIAGSLCYFLQRSRTGFKKSDTIISRLILFTVSTGLITSICAVASLISIILWSDTLIYVAFYFSLGRCGQLSTQNIETHELTVVKVYSNSLLATLNARKAIRELGGDGEDLSFSLQHTFSTPGVAKHFKSDGPPGISIKIETTQQSTHDLNKSDPDSHGNHRTLVAT
ncbi:hypothetical protein BDZ94DRAFT_1310667 [Collybia nuda]|uniref:DUF6534 domain-containing protein n=1 Tax=Collybia nuda TaxID=64659 RepID=A0A9P6CI04_9AGAR|nr:hypothetical protein BDZ94DRAFT_1310667 [Collybia nuda]